MVIMASGIARGRVRTTTTTTTTTATAELPNMAAILQIIETLSKHLRRLGGGGDGRAGVGLRPPPLGAKLEY